MKLTMHITEVKNWVSREAGTIITGNVIRGLAVGVLLMAGTGMYFGMTAGSAGSSHLSSEGTTAFPSQEWHDLMASGLEADLESYRSFLPNYVDEEGNPLASEPTTAFPSQDWHDLLAAGMEADIESYRSFLPNYVDEEGNPVSSEPTTIFPSDDWHDLLAAGMEADLEAYRSFLTNYVDEDGNPVSSS